MLKKKFNKNELINFDDLNINDLDLDNIHNEIGSFKKKNRGAKIELIGIGKKYEGNDKYTLKDINLTIEPGTFCIFLGPSGCGKTTTLRMIAGLNSITRGDLLFDGKKYNNLDPSERSIAMVFQSYALYPNMNVYNNISFGLKIAKERKDIIDRRVKDVAKILKIEDHLYNKPKDLSGGQRQRVAIGRAIARKPSVFLMDEPLSNLDAKLRETMRREIVEIHRMLNTTSIYVTHDQLEAMTMGDQIVVFNNGAIQQNGTSKDLYFRPKNIFVAQFIGSPTMNIFSGVIKNKKFIHNSGKLELKIDDKHLKNVSDGQMVKIGFRSEDVLIVGNDVEGFEAIIKNIEPLGKDQTIILNIYKSIEVISTVLNNVDYKNNQVQKISFNLERIHIFDEKSEERLN